MSEATEDQKFYEHLVEVLKAKTAYKESFKLFRLKLPLQLKRIREERNLTVEEFALQLNMHPLTVRQIESGGYEPSSFFLESFHDWLLESEEEPYQRTGYDRF